MPKCMRTSITMLRAQGLRESSGVRRVQCNVTAGRSCKLAGRCNRCCRSHTLQGTPALLDAATGVAGAAGRSCKAAGCCDRRSQSHMTESPMIPGGLLQGRCNRCCRSHRAFLPDCSTLQLVVIIGVTRLQFQRNVPDPVVGQVNVQCNGLGHVTGRPLTSAIRNAAGRSA